VQRRRLIDAVLRLAEKRQYEKTSVADIVREAGMSSRSFYDLFESKEDLVAEIVEEKARHFFEQLETTLAEPRTFAERVSATMSAYLELFPVGSLDFDRLGSEASLRIREVRRHGVQLLTDINMQGLEFLYRRGEIARVPARAAVELLLTGIEGMSFRYYSEGRREELLALHPVLLAVFLRILGDLPAPQKA
jgi:AcrR family transcriptional regulator